MHAELLTSDKDYNTEISDYIALLKPRVMSLVVFTGFAGLFLAPGNIHPLIASIAIFCIALGSGAAGAINMWYESDIDAKMERTKNRPIPSGRVLPENAFDFAAVCAFASIFIMAVAVNYTAASLLLLAILFYVFVYTIWLKRITPQNIVIGGAAGAFPPVIGWTAVTGSIDIEPLIMFAIIFMWTPPHFWALSLYKSADYRKAGIPMLPVVSGKGETRKHMLIYTVFLLPVTIAPYFIGESNIIYLAGASFLGIYFLYHAVAVFISKTEKSARRMFRFSIVYLFLLFMLMIVDKVIFF